MSFIVFCTHFGDKTTAEAISTSLKFILSFLQLHWRFNFSIFLSSFPFGFPIHKIPSLNINGVES